MAKKNTNTKIQTPDPMTLTDAMKLVRTWTKIGQGFIAKGSVEVSKRRIALTLWQVLDDGRLRMRSRQYVYCATTTKRAATAEWKWFCNISIESAAVARTA